MREGLNHGGQEHDDIFLLEGFLSAAEVSFKIGDALLHLNIALLVGVGAPSHFLENETAPVFDDVWVRVLLNLRKEFYLLPENEFGLFVVQSYLFYTLDIVLLIIDFVDYAIACSNHMPDLKSLVELTVPT